MGVVDQGLVIYCSIDYVETTVDHELYREVDDAEIESSQVDIRYILAIGRIVVYSIENDDGDNDEGICKQL